LTRFVMSDMGQALAIGMLIALLSGCAVGPDFKPPSTDLPSAWSGISNTGALPVASMAAGTDELAAWWRTFNDPELNALIEQAIRTNLDLKIAEARVRQARGARGVAAGGLWPAASASASYQRIHAGTSPVSTPGNGDLFHAGFDAVWELDLFGGLRRNVESAAANVVAAEEGLRDARVTLVAEVALNYIQLRGLQQQIAIAQNNLQAQRHTAEITHQRQVAGFVSALDAANADAQVATTESQIPVLEASTRQTIYALSILLARPPAALADELSRTASLPAPPTEIPPGLPSDLLRRRPDIRQAEAKLHAATAQIGVAMADLFPKFSLTGSLAWQNNLLRNWFTDASRASSFGPTVTWPVFQGGSILSNVRVQKALKDESYLTYQKTVLTGLQEVENALIGFTKEGEHHSALAAAVSSNRRAVELSTQLYVQGQTDFLNVLDAERSLYATEDALVQSDRSLDVLLIALYKALGGGWQPEDRLSVGKSPAQTIAEAPESSLR
jgi:multidrug efflux system outer membrane protein